MSVNFNPNDQVSQPIQPQLIALTQEQRVEIAARGWIRRACSFYNMGHCSKGLNCSKYHICWTCSGDAYAPLLTITHPHTKCPFNPNRREDEPQDIAMAQTTGK